jgi:hypothetical protein
MIRTGNHIALAGVVCVAACLGLTVPASASSGSTGATAPQTNILKAKVRRKHGLARFRFTSSEPGSSFRCKLDDHQFGSCSSPMTYRHLKDGRHAFRVRATNADGTSDATPARRRFFVGGGRFGGPPFPPYKHVEPARMFDPLSCPSPSSEVFWPMRSAWEVANRSLTTIVCAGGAGTDGPRNLGRFLIFHENGRWATQDSTFVDVPHSGPLKITEAPLGRAVVTTAPRHGELEFKGTKGIRGTLYLKDNSVTLDPELQAMCRFCFRVKRHFCFSRKAEAASHPSSQPGGSGEA